MPARLSTHSDVAIQYAHAHSGALKVLGDAKSSRIHKKLGEFVRDQVPAGYKRGERGNLEEPADRARLALSYIQEMMQANIDSAEIQLQGMR